MRAGWGDTVPRSTGLPGLRPKTAGSHFVWLRPLRRWKRLRRLVGAVAQLPEGRRKEQMRRMRWSSMVTAGARRREASVGEVGEGHVCGGSRI